MIIVVDTNIVFSTVLNSIGKIGDILLEPNNYIKFYSTDLLKLEISTHKDKIIKLSRQSEQQIDRIISIITKRINFIDIELIPKSILFETENILSDIDIDDTEFVSLAKYLNCYLWTGDKKLINGLKNKGLDICISTDDLFHSLKLSANHKRN